ncbi:MAG: MFS transporter [Acidimicrobiaceae bacterium]|nr:MFS transporter [Acidimicrobiaceae bacterium]
MPGPRLLLDLAPLRQSRDFRFLIGGQLAAVLGTQLTAVAVPVQVYRLTHSSLDVGLVSLAQLFPLMIFSLIGGSVIDAVDRRRLLIIVESLMALSSAALALNADIGPQLWPLFIFPAVTAGLSGFDGPARNAVIPNLVGQRNVASAAAMFQALFQVGSIVGPALGGILLAGPGLVFVYWLDVASCVVAALTISAVAAQPPKVRGHRVGLASIIEGLRYLKGRQGIQGAYVIDINAMVFGMPRALFPSLALNVFGGGASTVGFLFAAPGVGALIGALTTGWVTRIRRQGRAVIVAVMVWGAAIAGFGLVSSLPVALILLAVAGWADVISAVFRNTIIQLSTPNRLLGRLSGIQIAVVAGGPRLGDLESGAVATAFGNEVSVVSGGLACIVGALVLARLLPDFRRLQVSPEKAAQIEAEDAAMLAADAGKSGAGARSGAGAVAS